MQQQVQHQQHQREMNGGYASTATPSYGEQLREIHANVLPGVTRPEEGIEEDNDDYDDENNNPYRHPKHHSHNNNQNQNHSGFNMHPGTAQSSLQMSYAAMERQRERDRYEAYLDEQDSEKLPHAFDLGWRNNLRHLFGDRKWLWLLPICTTTGDGWHWEPSPKWLAAREDLRRRREDRRRREEQNIGWDPQSHSQWNGNS